MKRLIKFSYLLQHGDTGLICEKILTLDQIEDGKLLTLMIDLPRHLVIATRQFIGLSDKHEVEIYEGDILHFIGMVYTGTPGHFNSINKVLPVDFSDNNGFKMYEQGLSHYSIYSHEVEKIGDIYSNPELYEH